MRTSQWMGFVALLSLAAAGCGAAPEPTGPAGEATTPEVEISIPDGAASDPSPD